MDSFYLIVEQLGDKILERYIENGVEKYREIAYKPTLFTHTNSKTKFLDIYGKFCEPKKFESISLSKEWKTKTSGIVEILGMDDYRLAYISDVYSKKEVTYDKNYIRIANCDIEVTGLEFPDPRFAKYEIDALTHYDSIEDKYFVFDLLNSSSGKVSKWSKELAAKSRDEGGDEVPQELLDKVVYMPFDTEKEMLLAYLDFWEKHTPVIFTGWNVDGFDIPYIMNRLKNVLGSVHMKRISPFSRVTSKLYTDQYGGEREQFTILGICVLDYLELYKKFSFTTQPTYKLDFISEYETGQTKLEYDGPINKLRSLNHQRYISYNLIDVDCVQKIDEARGFIDLAISMGYYSYMNIASVMSPVKTWDAIIFNSLRKENKVLPEAKSNIRTPYVGAYVKQPKPSSYKYVVSFDVTSLYPSIIRQVNISPETIAGQFTPEDLTKYIDKSANKPSEEFSCSPNGMMYTKDYQGIIPKEITKVFFQRKDWKSKMMAAKRNLELLKSLT